MSKDEWRLLGYGLLTALLVTLVLAPIQLAGGPFKPSFGLSGAVCIRKTKLPHTSKGRLCGPPLHVINRSCRKQAFSLACPKAEIPANDALRSC